MPRLPWEKLDLKQAGHNLHDLWLGLDLRWFKTWPPWLRTWARTSPLGLGLGFPNTRIQLFFSFKLKSATILPYIFLTIKLSKHLKNVTTIWIIGFGNAMWFGSQLSQSEIMVLTRTIWPQKSLRFLVIGRLQNRCGDAFCLFFFFLVTLFFFVNQWKHDTYTT